MCLKDLNLLSILNSLTKTALILVFLSLYENLPNNKNNNNKNNLKLWKQLTFPPAFEYKDPLNC